jgi:tight adherence protein C
MSPHLWSLTQLEPLHIGAVFSIAMFLLLLLLARLLKAQEAVRRRTTVGTQQFGHAVGTGLRASETRNAERLMARLEHLLAPSRRAARSQIRKQLVQAGFFSASSVALFYASRIALAMMLPISLLASSGLLPVELPGAIVLVLAACLAMLGLVLPPILLDVRTRYMRECYRRAFPDFMDLLVVCIESGQSLPSALDRVGREIVETCPELGANLHLLNLELRAGSTITIALESLHGRLGIEEVQSLAVLLKQSEELGASIAGTLRVFSDEMRDKRLIRAETKANALPVKMTLPLGMFIFPVILLVILVPVVIRIKNAFV